MAAIVYGFGLFDVYPHKTAYVTYQTVFRAVWSICLAFIIFASAKVLQVKVQFQGKWYCSMIIYQNFLL